MVIICILVSYKNIITLPSLLPFLRDGGGCNEIRMVKTIS